MGAIFFTVFVVVDYFLFSSSNLSFVHKLPEETVIFFVIRFLIYGALGAVFGGSVVFVAALCDSMAAGLITGAVLMAAEKGIGMALIPGIGTGFQAFGLIVGAIYGLFFSWRILVMTSQAESARAS